MARQKWDSKTKARIVLEGLKGRSVASICAEYGVSQTLFYRWRDLFMDNIEHTFETGQASKREERLENENSKLKKVIGELTLELKKNDW